MFFFFYLFLVRCIYGCSTIARLNNDTMPVEVSCGASAVRKGYATLYVGSPEDCGSMLEDPVGYQPGLVEPDISTIAYEVTIDLSGQYVVESLESIVGGTTLPDPAQSTQEGVTELGYIALPELDMSYPHHPSYQKRQTEKKTGP